MGLAVFEGANTGRGAGAAALDPGYGRRSDSRQVAPLARAGAYVSLAGMALGVLGVTLPHPDSFDVPAMLLVQASTGLFALTFLIFANRVPMWLVRLTPAMGIVQVTAGVFFTHDPSTAYSLFYLWPCFYAFYFLPRVDAVVDVAILGICYGVAMVLMSQSDVGMAVTSGTLTFQFVVTFGSLAVAGLMIHALRTRVNRLWGSLSDAARTDLLTGFVNGHGINEILTNEIERARINTHRVGLITVNLNGLRQLNKQIGYEAGDEVLRELARLLNDSTRRIDTVGRTGAAEFVIVLPQTDEHTGFLLAEQILTRMRRGYRERGFNLSASIGVAVFPKHASNVDELLQASTAGMNAAVALGSDRVVVYSHDLEGAIEGDGPVESEGGPRAARHGAQPRRGARASRREQREPLRDRGRVLRDDRPRDGPSGPADPAPASRRASSTTSARSGSPIRSSTSPVRSRHRSGIRFAATPRWPRGSWPRASSPTSANGCWRATSSRTGTAIRAGCPATRSRWSRGSSPSPSPTTR